MPAGPAVTMTFNIGDGSTTIRPSDMQVIIVFNRGIPSAVPTGGPGRLPSMTGGHIPMTPASPGLQASRTSAPPEAVHGATAVT